MKKNCKKNVNFHRRSITYHRVKTSSTASLWTQYGDGVVIDDKVSMINGIFIVCVCVFF